MAILLNKIASQEKFNELPFEKQPQWCSFKIKNMEYI
jgi:hypothetical protein